MVLCVASAAQVYSSCYLSHATQAPRRRSRNQSSSPSQRFSSSPPPPLPVSVSTPPPCPCSSAHPTRTPGRRGTLATVETGLLFLVEPRRESGVLRPPLPVQAPEWSPLFWNLSRSVCPRSTEPTGPPAKWTHFHLAGRVTGRFAWWVSVSRPRRLNAGHGGTRPCQTRTRGAPVRH